MGAIGCGGCIRCAGRTLRTLSSSHPSHPLHLLHLAMSVIDSVRRTIRRHGLLPPGSRVAVALSGGADSVALLFALREIAGGRRLSRSSAPRT